jgi:tRNA dimethylallyltransferase
MKVKKVAAILGPTAVGKSRLAVEVAPLIDAEIVSVDSMLVYKGMDIGTAKPGGETRSLVPHHLIDIVDPSHEYSVAEFQAAARRAVEDIRLRGKTPLLVGGSGLYFEAVVFDLRFPPGSPGDPLRLRLEERALQDPEGLQRELMGIDPEYARKEDFRNPRRVARALEIYYRTGIRPSSLRRARGSFDVVYPYKGVVVTVPRPMLYRMIEERVDRMLQEGLVEEVKHLLESCSLSRSARQALGYKEIADHLEGKISLGEAVEEIKKRTRRYAKRQITWFRKIPGLQWMELSEEDLKEGLPRTVERLAAAVSC